MRVLVSVDMEGVAGVVAPEDIMPGHAEYERNRTYMTDEASAAVRGILAYEANASVVVCDAHAGYRNLLPDRIDRRCTLLRGSPRSHGMLTGIDGDVDAVCFVGYHGKAGTTRSVLAHTISGRTIARVRCNGRELGDMCWAAVRVMRCAQSRSCSAPSSLSLGFGEDPGSGQRFAALLGVPPNSGGTRWSSSYAEGPSLCP